MVYGLWSMIQMNSSLHIQVAQSNGRTFLQNCFFNPPYKVANITEDKSSGDLHLMLMSASPGILDGDEHTMQVAVEANASLCLHTQSYQRIYTMDSGARQLNSIHVGKNASLVFIPHPVVPHKNSSVVSETNIYLEEDAKLLWGEIISCGRKLNGEVFGFSKYHSKTAVHYKEKLILKENLFLQPSYINLSSMSQLQNFTHQATLIYLNEKFSGTEVKEKIMASLKNYDNIHFGITQTAFPGCMIRILGQQAEQLFDCFQHLSKEIFYHQKIAGNYAI